MNRFGAFAALAATHAIAPSAGAPPTEVSFCYSLRYLGDPILHTPCVAATLEDKRELGAVISALTRECARYHGLGLSANQVGSTLRVFVAYEQKERIVFVNPSYMGERGTLKRCPAEGCLSIPGFRTSTKRHEHVTLRWVDESFGTQQARTFHGLVAQVIQHEMDHLDGRLIVDGVSRQQRREAERLAQKAREKAESRT